MKTLGLVAIIVLLAAPAAMAVPVLQIYIEGATYDAVDETWVTTTTESLKLWAIGNTGAVGTIADVKLAIAYESGLTPTFSLSGGTTGGYNGFTDPSTASNPMFSQTVTDGSSPLLGDGTALPAHGIYGVGTDWTEYKLGDFTLMDSKIADFNGSTDSPVPHASKMGQINVYDISISGVDIGTSFHMDLYDHYYSQNGAKYKFAPFSHDGGTTVVPEPGTIALLGLGFAGVAARLRRKKQS